MHSIGEIQREDARELSVALQLDASTARIEVQCLLQRVLGVQRVFLLAHSEQVLLPHQLQIYRDLFQHRLRGEPIAHLLGEREFFGLNFKVTPNTLIPRPDTELLVELALSHIANVTDRVLDLGTGTGAIALSIAHNRPGAEVTAVDASEAALSVARENGLRLGINNVRFVQSDWFSALGNQRFDIIVSNPPYIAEGDIHLLQGDVRFEPLSALASGADGLDDIRRICKNSAQHLLPQGWLMFEHGYDQADSVRELLKQNGFVEIFSEKDMAGIDRVTGGKI